MSRLKLVVPKSVAEDMSREPGIVIQVADHKKDADFEFGLAEAATVVTIALGGLTAAEKLVKLAETIKRVVTQRRPKTIMVRGKHDDTKLTINDDTSVDELVKTLRDYIEE
jgi:hypothetical protein